MLYFTTTTKQLYHTTNYLTVQTAFYFIDLAMQCLNLVCYFHIHNNTEYSLQCEICNNYGLAIYCAGLYHFYIITSDWATGVIKSTYWLYCSIQTHSKLQLSLFFIVISLVLYELLFHTRHYQHWFVLEQ